MVTWPDLIFRRFLESVPAYTPYSGFSSNTAHSKHVSATGHSRQILVAFRALSPRGGKNGSESVSRQAPCSFHAHEPGAGRAGNRRGRSTGRVLVVIVMMAGMLFSSASAQNAEPIEFTFAHSGPIRTMDAPVTWFISTHWLTNTLYDCLIWRAADGDGFVGQSAERWEAIDDTTWRFYLREGITFQNGEPLDAAAVKWNLDRVTSREDFLVHPQWAFIKETVIVDDTTVDVITHEPHAYFEFDVSYNGCQLLPPGYMAEVGEEEFARNPVGSGPYRLIEFTASDRYVFEAWDDYWGGRPEVDRIIYQVIPEASSQIAALLSGQIDFVSSVALPDRQRVGQWPDIDLLDGPAGFQHLIYLRYQTETGDFPVRRTRALLHALSLVEGETL